MDPQGKGSDPEGVHVHVSIYIVYFNNIYMYIFMIYVRTRVAQAMFGKHAQVDVYISGCFRLGWGGGFVKFADVVGAEAVARYF